jgi:hypothetical protein
MEVDVKVTLSVEAHPLASVTVKVKVPVAFNGKGTPC